MARGDNKRLVGVGLGAGLLGAIYFALRYAIRPAGKSLLPETISPASFRTRVVHTSFGDMIYHEGGVSAPPLVFVHSIGLGASSYEWSKVYPAFADRFRVLAPDLIGFGESQRPDAQRSAADYVQMLAEFLHGTCRGETAILVGSGLGGGFCAQLASQHPDLVSRLILHMPTGDRNFGFVRLRRSARIAAKAGLLQRFLYRNYHSSRSAIRLWLTRGKFVDPARMSDEALEVYTTCAQQSGAEYAIRNFHAGRLNVELEARLRTVYVPVTFLWGGEPGFPSLGRGKRLLKATPNGSLRVLPRLGAFAALEDPQAVIDELNEQLDGGLRVVQG